MEFIVGFIVLAHFLAAYSLYKLALKISDKWYSKKGK